MIARTRTRIPIHTHCGTWCLYVNHTVGLLTRKTSNVFILVGMYICRSVTVCIDQFLCIFVSVYAVSFCEFYLLTLFIAHHLTRGRVCACVVSSATQIV